MLRTVMTALLLLFSFGVAWFIAVPTFNVVSTLFLNISSEQGWDAAENMIRNVINITGNALVWIGVLSATAIIIWMFVYTYRREVDTYEY